jgi:hypothetical protein
MVTLGVLLTVGFLLSGYLSLDQSPKSPSTRPRGPVKDPSRPTGLGQPPPGLREEPHQTGSRGSSLPFPDGVGIDRTRYYITWRRAAPACSAGFTIIQLCGGRLPSWGRLSSLPVLKCRRWQAGKPAPRFLQIVPIEFAPPEGDGLRNLQMPLGRHLLAEHP